MRDGARVVLTYRLRRPRGQHPDRGYENRIAVSEDGLHFTDVVRLRKADLGSTSIERTALVRATDGTWVWLVSYVDPADGRWRLDEIRADTLEGLATGTRSKVFTAKDFDGEGVKDPHVVRTPEGFFLILSCVGKPPEATDDKSMHGTNDVYNTGLAPLFNALATSADGKAWTWRGPCFVPVPGSWDGYQARIGCVLPAGPIWVGLYDGSASVEENYEERLGVCVSPDLMHWQRISTEGPVVQTGKSGSVRYADVLPCDDGLWVYFECSRPDGAHELRRSLLRWKV